MIKTDHVANLVVYVPVCVICYHLNLFLLGAARMIQHSETEHHIVEKLQLVKKQSTQLEEGIASI